MNRKEIGQMTEAYIKGFKECRDMVLAMLEQDEQKNTATPSVHAKQEDKTEPKKEDKQPKQSKPKKQPERKFDTGKAVALHKAGWTATAIAQELGVSVATISLFLKSQEDTHE